MVEKPGGLTLERIRYVLILWGRTHFLAGTASGCIRPKQRITGPLTNALVKRRPFFLLRPKGGEG